ncbi:hypothetical protein HY612_02640 [Candidatus Roizmanbacteria bacterium]|nr:hypothetical protein [Candidatus Roizmanbacteria bacterium]
MTEGRILEIKGIPDLDSSQIVGQHPTGGIINLDGRLFWLRHPSHRYNGGSWGWENDGFTNNDTTEVGYHLIPLATEQTHLAVSQRLDELKMGILPKDFTTGVEIEGDLYDTDGQLIPKHDGFDIKIEEDQHPELVNFTVETATVQRNGSHLKTPTDIAHGLAEAVGAASEIAQLRNGMVVHASVPEGGRFEDGTVTQHPYLISFSPKVLRHTLDYWNEIPQVTKDLYRLFGIDPQIYLAASGNLNWPVNALHVHSGVPQIENLGDPRAAYAYGVLRLTEFAKIASFMLFNTRHIYGIDTGLADVRSVMRRLLATTVDSTLPASAHDLIQETINAIESGAIHSPSRYPASGQHDRIRFRSEGQYKTVESIDANMNPDLRLVLTWAYFNQVMNVIALDAIAHTKGDESQVIAYLQTRIGNLLSLIPAVGKRSSYEQDLLFNKEGYTGRVSWIGNKKFKELLEMVKMITQSYGEKYPAVRTQSKIVSHLIGQQLLPQIEGITLSQYFGIESGKYSPNGLNRGIITGYKQGVELKDLLNIQALGTRLQAEALTGIRDENDLLAFFGIN